MHSIPFGDLPTSEGIPFPLEGLEGAACGPLVVRERHRDACLGGRERGGRCLRYRPQAASHPYPMSSRGGRRTSPMLVSPSPPGRCHRIHAPVGPAFCLRGGVGVEAHGEHSWDRACELHGPLGVEAHHPHRCAIGRILCTTGGGGIEGISCGLRPGHILALADSDPEDHLDRAG